MRRRAGSRGGTCVEIAILLGIMGALIIFIAGTGIRKLELAQSTRGGAVRTCR